jgi:hypothetical protein
MPKVDIGGCGRLNSPCKKTYLKIVFYLFFILFIMPQEDQLFSYLYIYLKKCNAQLMRPLDDVRPETIASSA